MSFIESIADGIGNVLEKAKDMPTEKIAAVGLIILGAAAVAKDLAQGGLTAAADKVSDIIDSTKSS